MKKNWDLKRDFHRKNKLLVNKTERAMRELIRRQMTQNQGKAATKAAASSSSGQEEQQQKDLLPMMVYLYKF